jgi:beta-amyrin synthase
MCVLSLSCNETNTLISQVTENPSGDFKSMHRHISKGSWTFSDQDHGWQVSDCTAEGLKV